MGQPTPPVRRPLAPLLAAAAALALIGAVAVWLPLGPTSSGPEPTIVVAPQLADDATTTTAPAPVTVTSVAGSAATTTTQAFPPPHPPEPFVAETALGHLRWEGFELPISLTDGSISGIAERADGTLVALGVGPDGTWMLEEDGAGLAERPVTGIDPSHRPWRAVPTALGLAAGSIGSDGPAIWIESAPGHFDRWHLEMPTPPAAWLRTQSDFPVLVSAPGGLEVFGGYWGWTVDWAAVVGAETGFDEYWVFESGELVVWSGGVATHRYDASVDVDGDLLAVRVFDRSSGAVVAEESVVTEHAASIASAMTAHEHHTLDRTKRVPLRWQVEAAGEFRLVEPAETPASGDPFERRVVHTGEQYVAFETLWDGSPQGSSRLLVSDDGGIWTDMTPDLGAEHFRISGIAVRDGIVGLLAHLEGRVQIAERVTVTGTFTSVFTSADLVNWTAAPLGDSSGHDVHDLAAGPLGWVASGTDCAAGCQGTVWLSRDGIEWEQVDLQSSELIPEQGNVFVGTNRIAWPSYSHRRDQAAIWVATLQARRG